MVGVRESIAFERGGSGKRTKHMEFEKRKDERFMDDDCLDTIHNFSEVSDWYGSCTTGSPSSI